MRAGRLAWPLAAGVNVVKLLATSGVGAIAQQSLISPVLHLTSFIGAGLGGLMGYLAEDVTGLSAAALAQDAGLSGRYASYGGLIVPVVIGMAVGYFLTGVGLESIDAGAKALFVCYAESPRTLEERSPDLATKLGEGAALKKDELTKP